MKFEIGNPSWPLARLAGELTQEELRAACGYLDPDHVPYLWVAACVGLRRFEMLPLPQVTQDDYVLPFNTFHRNLWEKLGDDGLDPQFVVQARARYIGRGAPADSGDSLPF